MTQPLTTHVPDYERLCALTRRIPGLDPDDIIALVLLRAVAANLGTLLQENLERYNISEGRLRVLGHLLDRDQPATHSEIAAASSVTKGTVTGLVDGLERDGLVCRTMHPDDRRISLIGLTEAGEETLQQILPGHLKRLAELMGGITKSEQQTLTQLLRKLNAGLNPDANHAGPTGGGES